MTATELRVEWAPAARPGARPTITHYDAMLALAPDGYWRLGDTGSPAVNEVGALTGAYSGAQVVHAQPGATRDGGLSTKLGDYHSAGGGTGIVTFASDALWQVTAWSVAIWFRTFGRRLNIPFLVARDNGAAAGRHFDIFISTTGQLFSQVYNAAGAGVASVAAQLVDDGLWHLAVLSDTGTSMVLKVDNYAPVTTGHTASAVINGRPLLVGEREAGGGTTQYVGWVAELGWWQRVLTEPEKVSLWDAQRGSGEWSEFPGCLRSYTVDRGRQRALDRAEPATLDAMFGDPDRELDPIVNPEMRPNRRIRLVATRASVDSVRFSGLVSKPSPDYEIGGPDGADQRLGLLCHDERKRFDRLKLPASWFDAEVLRDEPQGFWRIDDVDSGELVDQSPYRRHGVWVAGDPSIESADGLVLTAPYGASSWPPASYAPGVVAGYARIFTASAPALGRYLTYEFGFKLARLPASASLDRTIMSDSFMTIRVRYDDGGVNRGKLVLVTSALDAAFSTIPVDDDKRHHAIVAMTPAGWSVLIDGVDRTQSISFTAPNHTASSMFFGAGAGLNNMMGPGIVGPFAVYDHPLSSDRKLAHWRAFSAPYYGYSTSGYLDEMSAKLADWPTQDLDLPPVVVNSVGPVALDEYAGDHLTRIERTEDGHVFVARDGTLTMRGQTDPPFTPVATIDCDTDNKFAGLELDTSDGRFRNTVTATRDAGTVHTARASADELRENGEISEDLGQVMSFSAAEADTLVTRVRARLADQDGRLVRIASLSFVGNTNDALMDMLLAAEEGDVYKVIAHPPVGAAIEQDSILTTVTESWSATDQTFTFDWQLEPVPTTT